MPDILVNDITCTVSPRYQGLSVIRSVCRARPDGYQFMPRYKSHVWDGYISLMLKFNEFPTGLLSLVTQALNDAGVGYSMAFRLDAPEYSPVSVASLPGISLRDYQVECANILLQHGRGVAKMATNSGKTEVMAAMLKSAGCPSLVIVNRKELMYQTRDRFIKYDIGDIGLLGDGIFEPKDVTVAMIQSLALRKDLARIFKDVDMVLVDECHHTSSDQYMDVLGKVPGYFRFGFSGTPLKHSTLSDMKLIAWTGPVRYELDNSYLIANGYSAQPVICIHHIGKKSDKSWDMEYAEAYDTYIVNSRLRNNLIAKIASKANGSVLVLVNNLNHGRILSKLIPGSTFVHGSDSTDFRKDVLTAMRSDGIFIASPIFDEGIDVPSLNCVILAGGGKSHIKLLQRIGRGLRRKPGDNILTVHDFTDACNKHLLSHSISRSKVYEQEGFEVSYPKSS